jgi:hypothetical protein
MAGPPPLFLERIAALDRSMRRMSRRVRCQPSPKRSRRRQAPRFPPSAESKKVSELKGPAKSMYESMSEGELDKMASTKRKNKPQHAAKKK